eukprot:6191051-Pleurochrysis_carterae.AAC.4
MSTVFSPTSSNQFLASSSPQTSMEQFATTSNDFFTLLDTTARAPPIPLLEAIVFEFALLCTQPLVPLPWCKSQTEGHQWSRSIGIQSDASTDADMEIEGDSTKAAGATHARAAHTNQLFWPGTA